MTTSYVLLGIGVIVSFLTGYRSTSRPLSSAMAGGGYIFTFIGIVLGGMSVFHNPAIPRTKADVAFSFTIFFLFLIFLHAAYLGWIHFKRKKT